MGKYYCDYCDTYLTHDSPSVRKTHNGGRRHKENVRLYYVNWLEQQAQSFRLGMMRPLAPGLLAPPGVIPIPPMGMPPGMMMPPMGLPPRPGMMPPPGMPMPPRPPMIPPPASAPPPVSTAPVSTS